MNNNGIAVILGLIVTVSGVLNQGYEHFRIVVSIMLMAIGIVVVMMGIMSDEIG